MRFRYWARVGALVPLVLADGWCLAGASGQRTSAPAAPPPTSAASLSARAGEFVFGVLEQGESDMVVSVFAGDGSRVGVFDSFAFGSESIAFFATRSDSFTFRVSRADGRPLRASALPRVGCRAPEPADSTLTKAIRLATEAKQLLSDRSAAHLELALAGNREAVRLWQDLGDRSAAARSLLKIGDILYMRSAFAEALTQYREAAENASAIDDRRVTAEALNNGGLCALQLGEPDEALDLLRRALTDWRTLRHSFGESATTVNLGLLSWRLGLFDEALAYQRNALAVFLRLKDRRSAALARNNLGLVYSSLGKAGLAMAQLQLARGAFHALRDAAAEGQALVNIGYLQLLRHQDTQAIKSQQQALGLLTSGSDVRAKADAMSNLGRAKARTEPTESLRLLNEALALYEGIGDRRGQANALHHMGRVHTANGEMDSALHELDRAFQIRCDAHIPDAAAESLFETARILEHKGRLPEAAKCLAKVVEMAESLRASAGGEGFRTSYYSSKQIYFETYVDLLMRMGRPAEALSIAERARGRSLLDSLSSSRQRISSSADAGLLAQKDRVERRISFYSQQLLSLSRSKPDPAREAELGKAIDELLAERDFVEGQIAKNDPRYGDLWNPKPAQLGELQSLLDDQTGLLEFALGDRASYLWVVTCSDMRVFTLPRRAELEATARTITRLAPLFRVRERDPALERRFTTAIMRVARQLFGAQASAVDKRRWVVIPDGMLHYLPFAAVRRSIPHSDLHRDDAEVLVLPSASALAMLRRNQERRRPAERAIALFADPVFDPLDARIFPGAADGPAVQAGRTLARLPYSRAEAQSIAGLVPGQPALVALDFEASKKVLLGAASRYRILHLSTHAALDDGHPDLSWIALSQVDRRRKPVDGYLRLFEIYNLKLSDTELVVLSACKSGTGAYVGGEGLVGFARGFFYAGAGAVLATLWAVEDQGSQELVRRFYEGLLVARLRPAAALARAQRSLRTGSPRWRDPYYWAGFVLLAAPD